ncbi:NERD domain-containing protein [Paenisporosarcina sp.]|uniref:NERD domain-containing protein n=1 Tax=Paenisporosarcina sp. TaxID=1932001 RepID=UPI003C73DF6C
MSFIRRIVNKIMDTEDLKSPIILQNRTEESILIKELELLKSSSDQNLDRSLIEEHLKLAQIGLSGEKNVMYELKHSFIPMIILHDVEISIDDYHAQYDFIILTHQFIFVLEVKKFVGNIIVSDGGDFTRVVKKGTRTVFREGVYSPLRQAKRQRDILNKYLREHNLINKTEIISGVTFANERNEIDLTNAPEEVKSMICKIDGLVSLLEKEQRKLPDRNVLPAYLFKTAYFILNNQTRKPFSKQRYLIKTEINSNINTSTNTTPTPTALIKKTVGSNELIEQKLREFRKKHAKEKGYKAFHIFSDATLNELLLTKPVNKAELIRIKGIGNQKVNDFGDELLNIINLKY